MFFNNFISKKLSFYRTKHIFQHYKDFKSIEELKKLINFSVKKKKLYYFWKLLQFFIFK